MPIWFEIRGSVTFRGGDEPNKLIESLKKQLMNDIVVDVDIEADGTFELYVEGGQMCSYSTAEEVCDTLRELAPYAVHAAMFTTSCDGESGDFWVGDPEDIVVAERGRLVDEARNALAALTVDERRNLLQEFHPDG